MAVTSKIGAQTSFSQHFERSLFRCFFPTCQVRVVKFYVSCRAVLLLLLLLVLLNRKCRMAVFPPGPEASQKICQKELHSKTRSKVIRSTSLGLLFANMKSENELNSWSAQDMSLREVEIDVISCSAAMSACEKSKDAIINLVCPER